MNLKAYQDLACSAAYAAGKVHKKYFATDLKVRTKTSSFDLLTEADLKAEEKIVSIIHRHFPEHNILAEEGKYPRTDSEYTWIIDPLDGTNNFVFRLPMFSSSIALARKQELLVAVVYNTMHQELFTAVKDQGAFLNGKKISVAGIDQLAGSLLITGFYYDRGEQMIKNLEWIKQFFLKKIIGLRRFGSAALDLCYLACGRVAGFWEFELSPWDFAAGKLIIEEAGGQVTGRYGEAVPLKTSFIVASNGKIHQQMLAVLQ